LSWVASVHKSSLDLWTCQHVVYIVKCNPPASRTHVHAPPQIRSCVWPPQSDWRFQILSLINTRCLIWLNLIKRLPMYKLLHYYTRRGCTVYAASAGDDYIKHIFKRFVHTIIEHYSDVKKKHDCVHSANLHCIIILLF